MGTTKGRPDILRNVATNLEAHRRAVPLPNLQNTEIYLGFNFRMLDFSVFPNLSRHPQAAAAGLGGKRMAWDWIQG